MLSTPGAIVVISGFTTITHPLTKFQTLIRRKALLSILPLRSA